MTELETKIDQEVGLDTESHRVQFLKYVNYGRQLELEQNRPPALAVLDEVEAVLKKAHDAAGEVEKVDEDEAFQSLKNRSDITNPIVADLMVEFAGILSQVDRKHGEIIAARDEDLKAIKAKYE